MPVPPNPSEDVRTSQVRRAISKDEDAIEAEIAAKDEEKRTALRRQQQDEPGPKERRQHGGARRGL